MTSMRLYIIRGRGNRYLYHSNELKASKIHYLVLPFSLPVNTGINSSHHVRAALDSKLTLRVKENLTRKAGKNERPRQRRAL